MAFILADRVRETSGTTGTGSYALAGAVSGFRTFASTVGNANSTIYAATMGSQWEVGYGTVSTAGPSLSRDTIEASSNAGSAVSWTTGTKDIRSDLSARHALRAFVGVPIWGGTLTSTGGDALILNPSPAIIGYWPGMMIYGLGHISLFIDSPTPTLNVNDNGAVLVKRWNGSSTPLMIGEDLFTFIYDGTVFRIASGS